jgi:hypothetical protein
MKPVYGLLIMLAVFSCRTNNKTAEKVETWNKRVSEYKNARNKDNNAKIIRIAVATGGCEGPCPLQAYQVDSALNVSYFGGLYAEPKGYYSGKITRTLWIMIRNKYDSLNLRNYDSAFYKAKDDPLKQMVVCYTDLKKNIRGDMMGFPAEINNLHQWTINKLRKIKLNKTNKILEFETGMQGD